MVLANTIIADNTAPTGPNVSGLVISQGFNLVRNPSGSTGFIGTDLFGLDPRLTPLADYGGPTLTHGLISGSPAINAANTTGAPPTDQRGLLRTLGGTRADIGAFEFFPPRPDAVLDITGIFPTDDPTQVTASALLTRTDGTPLPNRELFFRSFGDLDGDGDAARELSTSPHSRRIATGPP